MVGEFFRFLPLIDECATGYAELQDLVYLLDTADESFVEVDFLLQILRKDAEPGQPSLEQRSQRMLAASRRCQELT